jgi:hypothetical protein
MQRAGFTDKAGFGRQGAAIGRLNIEKNPRFPTAVRLSPRLIELNRHTDHYKCTEVGRRVSIGRHGV